MNWFGWVCLFGGIGAGALVLHGWLVWHLWGKLRALGRESATVAKQLGEVSAQLGELGFDADGPSGRRPNDVNVQPRAHRPA